MYKTETHLHTAEVSHCGKLCAQEMVAHYHAAGYHTLFVTDHMTQHNFDCWGDASWEDKVRNTLRGYQLAKEAGEKCGMTVLRGVELHLNTAPNDYLLYDFDETFLNARQDLFDLTPAQLYVYAQAHGVTVVQAHPMRDGVCVPTPDCVDALEAYNPNPRHENYAAKTCALAAEYGLPVTSGSDAHRLEDIARGGVVTDRPIVTAAEYVRLLKGGMMQLIKGE